MVQSYQHDVWKLASSLVLVARELKLGEDVARKLVKEFSEAYKDQVDSFADDGSSPTKTVFDVTTTKGILKKFLEGVIKKKSRQKMLASWTTLDSKGSRKFQSSNVDLAPLGAALFPYLAFVFLTPLPFRC